MTAAVGAACSLVRLWAHVYTAGLPARTREVRLDEIESDLWESTHDAGRVPLGAAHVIARLLLGVPDDLRWRASRASSRSLAAAGLSLVGAAVAVTWFYVTFLGPQTLPRPHGQPMNFVSDRPAPSPPPPPPPRPGGL
jgi:hypothetical protein